MAAGGDDDEMPVGPGVELTAKPKSKLAAPVPMKLDLQDQGTVI